MFKLLWFGLKYFEACYVVDWGLSFNLQIVDSHQAWEDCHAKCKWKNMKGALFCVRAKCNTYATVSTMLALSVRNMPH